MSDAPPPFSQDYYSASVIARYGYYGSVLHPGTTDAQIKAEIVSIQTSSGGPLNQPLVTSLDAQQRDSFVANYEIVSSSAGNAQAQAAGLDFIIL